jgi:hypothetical protein
LSFLHVPRPQIAAALATLPPHLAKHIAPSPNGTHTLTAGKTKVEAAIRVEPVRVSGKKQDGRPEAIAVTPGRTAEQPPQYVAATD